MDSRQFIDLVILVVLLIVSISFLGQFWTIRSKSKRDPNGEYIHGVTRTSLTNAQAYKRYGMAFLGMWVLSAITLVIFMFIF